MLFKKKCLCIRNLLPMHEIFIEKPIIFENILHCVTTQDLNHSGHERGMMKEAKQIHLPALHDS